MKKIYIILGLFFLLFCSATFSQKIWNSTLDQYAFNPAGGGINDIATISTSYYNTFGSANNSPYGFLVMGTAPFPSDNIAAGFKVTTESGGVLNNTSAEGTFVYKLPVLKNSKLAFGISAVYNQLSLLRDRLNPQSLADPVINNATTGYWGDANFGVDLYEPNKYYVGLAANNLLSGTTNWRINDFTNRSARLYSLSGMYTFNVMQGDGRLELTGLAASYLSKGSSIVEYNANARFIVKKSYWFGAGYANSAVKFLVGVYFQNFSIGYAGAISMGDITKYTYAVPMHELLFKIDFNNSKASRPKSSN